MQQPSILMFLIPIGILVLIIVGIQLLISRILKPGCFTLLVRVIATVAVIAGAIVLAGNALRNAPVAQAADVGGAQMIDQSLPVQAETIAELGDLNVAVSATGTVSAIRQVELAFELSAPVEEILVQEGQSVQEGDVLARLDAYELEAALQDAEISYLQQQTNFNAEINTARDVDIAVAEAELEEAERRAAAANVGAGAEDVEIARLQTELSRNQLWQQQLDAADILAPEFRGDNAEVQDVQTEAGIRQAEYQVDISDANYADVQNTGPDAGTLASAEASIVQAEVELNDLLNGPDVIDEQKSALEVEIARLAVERARANLDAAVLLAPFDGIIARNNLVVGEVPPSNNAIELIDTSSYYIDVAVDETDIVGVDVGQAVNITLDALPEANISGTVTRVAKTSTLVGDVVTYTVRVTLDPALAGIRVGMNATADIVVSDREDVILVPNRFIRLDRSTEQAFVTIQNDEGQYQEVQVVLGERNNLESEIVSGLEPGQRIVLLPQSAESADQGGGPGGDE
jgi:RND family efflux transporter MFP subunit